MVCVLAAAASGCGRKGDPLPPILQVPETTTDLSAVQVQDTVRLSWSYPALTRAGANLTDLERIEVWRLEIPPGQEGSPSEELRRQLMLTRGKVVTRLEGPALEQATRGSSLVYHDPLPVGAGEGAPPVYWYAVRSRRADGTASALSNIVAVRPAPVPPAVTGLKAETGPDGIALTWDAQDGATYVVDRRQPSETEFTLLTGLLDSAGFKDTTATQGETWVYAVRAMVGGAVGPRSEPLEVPYPDVYAPAPVQGLVCLPEPDRVRLSWDPISGSGVVVRVLRQVGGGEWVEVTATATANELVDSAPPAGEVTYAVTAVDDHGNESEEARCQVRVGP